jgi:hypothetical protein
MCVFPFSRVERQGPSGLTKLENVDLLDGAGREGVSLGGRQLRLNPGASTCAPGPSGFAIPRPRPMRSDSRSGILAKARHCGTAAAGWNAAKMRIELPTRAAADALTDYLRRCECIVSSADDCVQLTSEAPGSPYGLARCAEARLASSAAVAQPGIGPVGLEG